MSVASIVRKTPADALAEVDPYDGRLEGVLYVSQHVDVSDAEAEAWLPRIGVKWRPTPADLARARAAITAARLRVGGEAQLISGGTLATQAATPFVLDGVTYPTLHVFYEALKLPEPARAAFIAAPARRAGRGKRDAQIEYRGTTFAVGSLPHLQLIARAVSAKVAAHREVRDELAATGRARLFMGYPQSQPLGRVVPFAYMVERLRLGGR